MDRTFYTLEDGRAAGIDGEGEVRRLGEVEADEYHIGWISPEGQTYESYIEYLVSTICGIVLDEEAATKQYQTGEWLAKRADALIAEHCPDEYANDVATGCAAQFRTHLWLRGMRPTP